MSTTQDQIPPRYTPIASARHFTFARPIEAAINRAAETHGVTPTCLVAAIVQTALSDDLLPAIFDGRPADALAAPICRDAAGLTRLQAGFVYIASLHAGREGLVEMSGEALAALLGLSKPSSAFSLRNKLISLGLIELARPAKGSRIRRFGLTPDGWRVARELAGADFSFSGDA
ncbi:hypothetical protein [Pararhizobium haloflavum]|uniref:hypothetical protein n=1 Tax=Pararhizobium haloflavum TaxID=2037914 RepID=UPI000C19EE2F|nr:hypothetical protein [Pararhizobium haloflavum]